MAVPMMSLSLLGNSWSASEGTPGFSLVGCGWEVSTLMVVGEIGKGNTENQPLSLRREALAWGEIQNSGTHAAALHVEAKEEPTYAKASTFAPRASADRSVGKQEAELTSLCELREPRQIVPHEWAHSTDVEDDCKCFYSGCLVFGLWKAQC